jgi:two-component system, OmpR family, sensor kinase
VPRRPSIFGALSLPGIPLAVLGIALIVSALASWWLAQHLSAPIRRIQEGARAVASEQLDVRVSAGLDGRKDELAVLARDFDAMADQLKATRSAARGCCATSRTNCARRSRACAWRWGSRASRSPTPAASWTGWRRDRAPRFADQPGAEARAPARHRIEFQARSHSTSTRSQEVVRDANFEGAIKGCTVITSGRPTRVRGNRELLRSAIENVLRNAVRYSPAGRRSRCGERRRKTIGNLDSRSGPGVPGGDLERIFEPFFRVAESRDRDSGGEGIGLAITAQVLKAHGGSATAPQSRRRRPRSAPVCRCGRRPAARFRKRCKRPEVLTWDARLKIEEIFRPGET